ncbi:MAG TPA: RNA-binding protein [Thermoanaerobaculia bacterium]|nr:RNA-binding protein [Thermoanaerobaculia bacterium]
MASKTLFRTSPGKLAPRSDAVNEEGGAAYALEPRHALACYAATGCLSATFYASAEVQLDTVLGLCEKVEPEWLAKTAVYARERAVMKDLPALLAAALSMRSADLLRKVFPRVIDSPKMLRNFVQIVRSGAVGRKSLGTVPKQLVLRWLEERSDEQLFNGSVGNAPSLADILRMVHPKPATKTREALYGWLLGREVSMEELPPPVAAFERFKTDPQGASVPDVPFQMLTALPLGRDGWTEIARRAPWQMTRMNLNTFQRHGVFEVPGIAEIVAERLRAPELIAKARVLPYQLLMAFVAGSAGLPSVVREALQDAMEVAIQNVPRVEGKVWVFPDVSGSMHSPVTGHRRGSTSAVRCIDVAALVAAAILRKNPDAEVVPFESNVVQVVLNPRDSVMTNAQKLASLPAGGTNCSAPLKHLNERREKGDLVVYVSDNESWVDSPCYGRFGGSATETMLQWEAFKQRSPSARMLAIDLQPYGTVQAKEREDIVNVGGFSDQVFQVIADVAAGRSTAGYWVQQIESIEL